MKTKSVAMILCLCAMTALFTGCGVKINVETREASSITDNDALINGYVSDYEKMPQTVGVYFGTSESNMNKIIKDKNPNNKISSNDIDVTYDISVDGEKRLEPDTTYYYCFYVLAEGKEKTGEVKSFKTLSKGAMPKADITVTTGKADSVTQSNAVLYGNISDVNEKPDEKGVYIGTEQDNMIKAARDKNPMGSYDLKSFDFWYDFSTDSSYLIKPATTYYYQCYAKIGDSETRGEIKTFTTPANEETDAKASATPNVN